MNAEEFKTFLYKQGQKLFRGYEFSSPNKSRILELHPSELPFCGYRFMLTWLQYRGNIPCNFANALTLNTGTLFHEIIERYMAENCEYLFGNWKCKKCGKEFFLQTKPEDCCGELEYLEIPINYKNIVGHIDTILKVKDKYWIVDYKTTCKEKLPDKVKDPGMQYKMQILTYAYCLEKQYNIPIEGVSLFFFAKEAPSLENTTIYSRVFSEKDRKKIRKCLLRFLKMKQKVLNVKTYEEFLALDLPKCSNPYCSVCREDKSLEGCWNEKYLPISEKI